MPSASSACRLCGLAASLIVLSSLLVGTIIPAASTDPAPVTPLTSTLVEPQHPRLEVDAAPMPSKPSREKPFARHHAKVSARQLGDGARLRARQLGDARGRGKRGGGGGRGKRGGGRGGGRGGSRGRGREGGGGRAAAVASAIAPRPGVPASALAAACVPKDALVAGDDSARYILLRMAGNDKFLAPREQGVVYAAVRRRFRVEGSAPLSRIAWRIVPQRNGWVQLQHVLTGRWMRLVPPPDPIQWVVRAELDPSPFGKQTWFRLEGGTGEPIDYSSSATIGANGAEVHLRCHSTGAYLNYRGRPVPTEEDFIRGHGNQMQGGKWAASPRAASTKMFLEAMSADALVKDGQKWEAARAGCLAPCSNATAAAQAAREGGVGWSEVCWKHYAEATCNVMLAAHGETIGHGGGVEAHLLRARWARLDCEKYVERATTTAQAQQRPRLLTAAEADEQTQQRERQRQGQAGGSGGGGATGGSGGDGSGGDGSGGSGSSARLPHCAPLVGGMLLLLVSDRPNQFLCHYFESALLHGLSPTVLGWDDSAWASAERKPWTYYLGGKLVLPLEYLERCGYPDDALVLFTDHDVVFQGGAAQLRKAYNEAVRRANGAPLIFSAEKESYPRELQGLYPRNPYYAPADRNSTSQTSLLLAGLRQQQQQPCNAPACYWIWLPARPGSLPPALSRPHALSPSTHPTPRLCYPPPQVRPDTRPRRVPQLGDVDGPRRWGKVPAACHDWRAPRGEYDQAAPPLPFLGAAGHEERPYPRCLQ